MDNILSLVVMLVVFEGLIVIGLVVLVVYLMRTKRQNDIHKEVYEAGLIQVKDVFEEKLKKLATKYAEETAAFNFFEELESCEVDIPSFSKKAQDRILALNIAKEEEAIVLCQSSLSNIRQKIESTLVAVSNGYPYGNAVAKLKEQENHALAYLEGAQNRLRNISCKKSV